MIVSTSAGHRIPSDLAKTVALDVALVVLADLIWRCVQRNKLLVANLLILACAAWLVVATVKYIVEYTVRFVRWAVPKIREAWRARHARHGRSNV
jgi:hypothetical protein